jgi:hypothetical protein
MLLMFVLAKSDVALTKLNVRLFVFMPLFLFFGVLFWVGNNFIKINLNWGYMNFAKTYVKKIMLM